MDNGGYDEFEHHVIGDYGIVKMLHLSTDDMDVDNDAFSACGKSDIPYVWNHDYHDTLALLVVFCFVMILMEAKSLSDIYMSLWAWLEEFFEL